MDAPTGPGGPDDGDVTRRYLEQIRSQRRDWDELEQRDDESVQLSRRARAALSEAVHADARRGSRVQMPPTDIGPYTLTELALRTLIRDAVDGTEGVVSLRTSVDYAPSPDWGTRGTPERVALRVAVTATNQTLPVLPVLAHVAREAVQDACVRELDLTDLVVDIHIEDLHEN